MTKRLTILLVLTFAGSAWADWGGTQFQDPDSMDITHIWDANVGFNYGIDEQPRMDNQGAGLESFVLVRPTFDRSTGGATQDSCEIHFFFSAIGEPDANESLYVEAYILRRDWGEGDKAGATADSCGATWDSAYSVGTDCTADGWATAGAKNTSSDRESPAEAISDTIVGPVVAGEEYTIMIVGAANVANVISYGVLLSWFEIGPEFGIGTIYLTSDDYTTDANDRTYMKFYETVAGTPEAVAGAATVGGATMGTGPE